MPFAKQVCQNRYHKAFFIYHRVFDILKEWVISNVSLYPAISIDHLDIVFISQSQNSTDLCESLQIPAKSATQSGGSRPPVPAEAGHPIRSKAAGYRSEATLIFL
jgi:hypothetical protein